MDPNLFSSSREYVRNFILRHGLNEHDAEDATQKVLLLAWSNLGQFRGACTFTTWLCAIAKRVISKHFRVKCKHETVDVTNLPLADPEQDPVRKVENEERCQKVHNAINEFMELSTQSEQQVFGLRYVEDTKFCSHGLRIGSCGCCRNTLTRVRKKLKSIFLELELE